VTEMQQLATTTSGSAVHGVHVFRNLKGWGGAGVHFRCTFSKVFKIWHVFHIKLLKNSPSKRGGAGNGVDHRGAKGAIAPSIKIPGRECIFAPSMF